MEKLRTNKKINGMVNGSFTVEMSFLLPIIIMFIFLIIYLIFYEHDNVRSQNILFENLRKKEQECLTNKYWKSVNIKSEKNDREVHKKGYFILKCNEYNSTKTLFMVKETMSMESICSITYVESLLKEIGLDLKKQFTMPLYDPSKLLRVYDGISECPDSESSWDYKNKQLEKIKLIFTFN